MSLISIFEIIKTLITFELLDDCLGNIGEMKTIVLRYLLIFMIYSALNSLVNFKAVNYNIYNYNW